VTITAREVGVAVGAGETGTDQRAEVFHVDIGKTAGIAVEKVEAEVLI